MFITQVNHELQAFESSMGHSFSYWQPLLMQVIKTDFRSKHRLLLERFSYDLEMKTREQKRNNKWMEIERFDWFIERIQTRGFWLVNRTLGWKNFENFLELNR